VTFEKPESVAKAVEEGRVFELDSRVLRYFPVFDEKKFSFSFGKRVQVANQKKEPRSGGGGGDRRGGGAAPREIKVSFVWTMSHLVSFPVKGRRVQVVLRRSAVGVVRRRAHHPL
jgi:hypothetical protein